MLFEARQAFQSMRDVEKFLDEHHFDCDDEDLVLKRSFNEAWFSNMLAWLLDPKGSHGLGPEFLKEFLKLIAQKRSDLDSHYQRKGSFLKWGKGGVGKTTSGLTLGNASVAREFFLSGEIGTEATLGQGFCDIVLLDLDSNDGLFVVIENKLFTTNHRNQLEGYFKAVESKYQRAKIREYVYLTFYGFPPILHDNDDPHELKRIWLRCSWTEDVASVLQTCANSSKHSEIGSILNLLMWMKNIRLDGGELRAKEFRLKILHAAAYCLEEELNRLGEGRQGSWSIQCNDTRVKLMHSSNPRSPLKVELLPNLSVAVQGYRGGKASFSKIVVPYGVNADQIFNLLDIAARDIYRSHFRDRAAAYLNTEKRRTRTHKSARKLEVKPIFDFVSAHCDSLRVLFSVLIVVWKQGSTSSDDPSQDCESDVVANVEIDGGSDQVQIATSTPLSI